MDAKELSAREKFLKYWVNNNPDVQSLLERLSYLISEISVNEISEFDKIKEILITGRLESYDVKWTPEINSDFDSKSDKISFVEELIVPFNIKKQIENEHLIKSLKNNN